MSPGRLDRYGDELLDIEEPKQHRCSGGWLDADTDHPKPCPVCRTELAERLARQRRRDWLGPEQPRKTA